MQNLLLWGKKSGDKEIKNLDDLLDTLINIKQENIDTEIKVNIIENGRLVKWLQINFSKKIGLIEELKSYIKEYTPQQIREALIRSLRKIT